MKAKCPECNRENEVIKNPDGFYFDNVEYRCECGYVLICSDYNYELAEARIKIELDIDKKRRSLINNVKLNI